MTSAKQWWKRAAAAVKDRRSVCLAVLPLPRASHRIPEMELAVIKATSHDELRIDYKNAARVFAWARASPSFVSPLMWALARRATRTRSWPVALKSLLLVHGLLLITSYNNGRLPFDLSEFRDRSAGAWGFSAFVRAYFHFLDHRTVLLSSEDDDTALGTIENLQALLDMLMQIRPYAGGMEVGLVLEAMDCVIIEIFDVYSTICSGIAAFLVSVLGTSDAHAKGEEWRRMGMKGIGVLRKAAEQSTKLSSYFDVCRSLGVLNATELPPVEGIPEEDIVDLEKMVAGGITLEERKEEKKVSERLGKEEKKVSDTVVTKEWVVFEDELGEARHGHCGKTTRGYAALVLDRRSSVRGDGASQWCGNLIDLM